MSPTGRVPPSAMKTLNFIGCGRVGQTLGRLWHQQQVLHIQDVLTTSLDSAQAAVDFIGEGRAVASLPQMRPANLWMIAVPDQHIAAIAHEMALTLATLATLAPAIAFHGSGALTANALAPLRPHGWQLASAHCILSFATPDSATLQFAGTACGLEGDEPATYSLAPLYTALGAACFALAADKKMLYHAAAVFATNFLPVLQAVAEDLWCDSGVPAALLPQLRATLLRHAVDNVMTLGPAAALTGPAARGDQALVTAQGLAVAQWDSAAGDAYRALSTLAIRLAHEGHMRSN